MLLLGGFNVLVVCYLCFDNMGYMVVSPLCNLIHYDLYETYESEKVE